MTLSPHLPSKSLLTPAVVVLATLCLTSAHAQVFDLPPDASHMPDLHDKATLNLLPDHHTLPSWGDSEPLLIPRLWPGKRPDAVASFEPEIQLPPEIDPTVIPDLYLADYFGTLPETYLVDPQTLLTAHERTSINQALRQHFIDHDFPVYILLFQKEQQIPEFQNLETLHKRWFSERPGMLVAFWLGSPTRTTASFGGRLREEFGAQLDRGFADALGQSYTKDYPFSQLDHFTYTLLWRLRNLASGATKTADNTSELEPGEPAIPDFDEVDSSNWVPIAAGGGVLALGAIAIGASVISRVRRREQIQREIKPTSLPVAPFAKRLTAPHSGGSGAVIRISPNPPDPKSSS